MSEVAYFDLGRERQCRALGHVFVRDFRHPTGEFELQKSDDCFRCGISFVAAEAADAEERLASEPA